MLQAGVPSYRRRKNLTQLKLEGDSQFGIWMVGEDRNERSVQKPGVREEASLYGTSNSG